MQHNKYFAVVNRRDRTTSITIAQPAGGRWTIRPLRGSSSITTVSQAPVEAPPGAAGKVTGRSPHLILHYVVEHQPGDTVTFYERGRTYEQQLGTAAGVPCLQNAPIQGQRPADSFMAHPTMTCGEIGFSPAPGPAGTRHIIAVISNQGEPVNDVAVTTYKAPAEILPPAPRGLKIVRRGTNVTITWKPSADAKDYNIDINLSDGSKLVDVTGTKRRRVVLSNIPTDLRVKVRVAGIRFDDVIGPASTRTSRATTAPPAPTA
jgi:hypothetical protein